MSHSVSIGTADPLKFGTDALSQLFPHDTIPKHKINKLILNYFIQEGFQNAAQSFSQEASLELNTQEEVWAPLASANQFVADVHADPTALSFLQSVRAYSDKSSITSSLHSLASRSSEITKGYSSIDKRREIKYLILKGDITQAIATISRYFPTVLDCNNLLLFKLLRLSLIEMIRSHTFLPMDERKFLDDILTFVRDNLISKVTHSYELLKELEVTMSLLCFNFDAKNPEELGDLPDELKQLFDLLLRNECYRVVNKSIIDLEDGEPLQQYKGPTFAEFSASLLQRLGQLDDVVMEGDEEEDFVVPKGETQDNVAPDDAPQVVALESRLEKIAMLWLVTEQRLLDKKVITEKMYGQTDKATLL